MNRPPWLKKDPLIKGRGLTILRQLKASGVHTVCNEAKCPNIAECFSRKCVTFMILGDACTRNCAFCGVSKSRPQPLDESEPVRVARAAESLGIRYCVITSVTRDDLEDGGAHQFARTVSMVKALGGTKVEVLTPDFSGDQRAVETVLNSSPDVFAHNVETVPRLYELIRPRAEYHVSISLLRLVQRMGNTPTKSGLILGLGEKPSEVLSVMEDLRECGCDIITLGQYLPPTIHHTPPAEYISPRQFENYRQKAVDFGFRVVFSGPFVRSSFQASKGYELCLSPLTPH